MGRPFSEMKTTPRGDQEGGREIAETALAAPNEEEGLCLETSQKGSCCSSAPISHVQGGCIVQDADREGVDGARACCQPGREPAGALDLSHDLAAADLRRLEHREREAQALPHDAGRSSSIPPCAAHQRHCLDPAAALEPVDQKMRLPSQQTSDYTPT